MSLATTEPDLMDGDALGKHHATTSELPLPEDSLHEKFVNFIHALSGPTEGRSEVWMEHSYARARRGGGAAPRSLLVRRAPPCPDCHVDEDNVTVDVMSVERQPDPPLSPEPRPHYELALSEEDICLLRRDEPEPDDWEEKLDSLAPSPTHRRLASSVVELIRSLRVARLSGAPRTARAHAAALRRELAPLWNYPGPLQQRPAAWMHAVLSAYLPRPYLHVYNDMLSEVARSVPRLVERLLAGQVPPAAPERESSGPRLQPDPDRPLVVWLPSGRERRDALWERNLAHVVPTHRIPAPNVSACAPDAWCAAVASSARAALVSAASVPRSATVLAGWGAGAALALHLASVWDTAAGPPPSAIALLSPPLLTAEGSRDTLDDPILDLKIPMLFVVGQNAMQCTVGVAEEVRASLGAWSRLVVVGAADDALRLTQHKLRTERVTQPMIYAAIAEEVRTFVNRALREDADVCADGAESEREPPEESEPEPELTPPPPPPPPANQRRRASAAGPASAAHKRQRYGVELASLTAPTPAPPPAVAAPCAPAPAAPPSPVSPAAPSAGKGRGLALLRVSSAPPDSGALHSATGRTTTDWEEVLSNETLQHKAEIRRNIRVTETVVTRGTLLNGSGSKGYSVVSRGTGSVPLCLPPPRRAAAAPSTTLAPADIMQLPIVFADDDNAGMDDERTPPSAAPGPSPASPMVGSIVRRDATPLKYTKVILAKRPTSASPASAAGSSPRPIIVKGGMKILPKGLIIKRGATVTPVGSPHQDKSPFDKSPV